MKQRGKSCPVCGHLSMKPAGRIKAGIRRGMRQVYQCKRCGYRAIR